MTRARAFATFALLGLSIRVADSVVAADSDTSSWPMWGGHNLANSSPTTWGDLVFVGTSNGQDESHAKLPAPNAPTVIALNKSTGKLVWSDNSAGSRVLHGQWSSPSVGTIGGVVQLVSAQGDGWVRGFEAATGKKLWEFDTNPKDAVWPKTRNELIATPVIAGDRVYIGNGQDPEHGEVNGGRYGTFNSYDVDADLGVSNEAASLSARLPLFVRGSDGYRDRENSQWGLNPGIRVARPGGFIAIANYERLRSEFIPDVGLPLLNGAVPNVSRKNNYQAPFDFSEQDVDRARLRLEKQLGDRTIIKNLTYFTRLRWKSDGTLFVGAFNDPRAGGAITARTLTLLSSSTSSTRL